MATNSWSSHSSGDAYSAPPARALPHAGVATWTLACLAGVALGLWREATFPTQLDIPTATLGALGTLAVTQVAWVLLIYPIVLLVRGLGRGAGGPRWHLAAEAGLCAALAVPFYWVAGYLSNAMLWDVVRTALAVAALWPLAWSAGAWLRRPRARTIVVLALILIAIGLPGAFYIAWDFLQAPAATPLWELAPATLAWRVAQPTAEPRWWPWPLWAWWLWPILAGAAALLLALLPGPAVPKDGYAPDEDPRDAMGSSTNRR